MEALGIKPVDPSSLRPIEVGEDLVTYCSEYLAPTLFKGKTRKTGLPYTTEHLAKEAALVSHVVLPTNGYQPSAIAAAWLHDGPEDIDGLDIYDPRDMEKHAEGVTYLNDLLRNAGELGSATCVIVNSVTRKKRVPYKEYFESIFTIPTVIGLRELQILSGVVKIVDTGLNTNPDERQNVNEITRWYYLLEHADAATLEKFYEDTNTIHAFRRRGDMSFDVGLFTETLLDNFREDQSKRALDNLSLYLPLAEERLLIDMGREDLSKKDGEFDYETAKDNGIFYWDTLRGTIKMAYINSLRLRPEISPSGARDMGRMKDAPSIAGYTYILDEIQADVDAGRYALTLPGQFRANRHAS